MARYILVLCLAFCVSAQKDAHFAPGRNTIVHLFEWKWDDIGNECETFLKPHGFGGVQISPPNENLIVDNPRRPWWERYQPVSYALATRSGNEVAFGNMVKKCNNAGVRIYVDLVINHMTGMNGVGTAGHKADHDNKQYPAVPYGPNDFHDTCSIRDYQNASNVRNCELVGLRDLNQNSEYVRGKIVDYMNHLIDLGVAGFRVDAAKHMTPADLAAIYTRTKNLNTAQGFAANARPFFYQEVIDFGGEAISKRDYNSFGAVLEFRYGAELGNVFQGRNKLSALKNWGPAWSLLDGLDAVAFVDNHDNQRGSDDRILTYKKPKPYKMAIAFMLAHPYGTTRLMSSFAFDSSDQGPPQDASGNLISPKINADSTCGNGFICEHRWREIYNMVEFRNAVAGTAVANWWSKGDQQIAFSRGNRGFVAFTIQGDINDRLQTGLPSGTYCDVISGSLIAGNKCSGKSVTVGADGTATIVLKANDEDGTVALHVNAKF